MNLLSEAACRMADFYNRESQVRTHDINHFMKVWGFAHMIGLAEGLDRQTQETLELAAVVHDISCPLCRRKYGSAGGRQQEKESAPLVEKFYRDFSLPSAQLGRILFLVSHHHTYTQVDGPDWQILLEADFLVNADEENLSREAICNFRTRVFKTSTGLRLLDSMYA